MPKVSPGQATFLLLAGMAAMLALMAGFILTAT
jgi:hypothetical protein